MKLKTEILGPNIEHPTSNIEHPMVSNRAVFRRWALDVFLRFRGSTRQTFGAGKFLHDFCL